MSSKTSGEFVCNACICNYTSCNLDNIPGLILCKGTNECLCIEEKVCCAAGEKPFPFGIVKSDGFIIQLGLPCCTCGLKFPDKLCLGSGECLCCKTAAALPFTDPVPVPVCAICAFSLMPEVGLMKAPPGAEMARV
jgi:hypothetical protein